MSIKGQFQAIQKLVFNSYVRCKKIIRVPLLAEGQAYRHTELMTQHLVTLNKFQQEVCSFLPAKVHLIINHILRTGKQESHYLNNGMPATRQKFSSKRFINLKRIIDSNALI